MKAWFLCWHCRQFCQQEQQWWVLIVHWNSGTLAALLRPPPLSPTATQPWSSPCSDWRPLVATTLTIGAWWNSDLLFKIKSAWLDVILTASFICLSRQLWKLPTTSIEKSCFSPLCASWQCFHNGESSLSFLKLSKCSSPRENAFLALSPS